MTSRLLLSISGACLLACKASSARPPVMVDPSVLPKVTSRESTWLEARTPIELSAGEASNCASYDRLKGTGIVEDVTNQLVKSEYLICDLLGSVGENREVRPMAVGKDYGDALASRLDLRSFPSSLGPRLDDDHHTLTGLFDARQLKLEPRGVTATTKDWSYVLRVVLVGDIDQSGGIDWLIWLTDEALDGNYRGYQSLVIKDVAESGLLRAFPQ